MTTFYKVYKETNFQNVGNKRINFGAIKIEPQYYETDIDMIFDLNDINNLKNRLNVEYIFTDFDKACDYAKTLKDEDV